MDSTLKHVCIMLFIFTAISSFAQSKNELFYVYKDDWSPAKSIDDCTYFMHEIKKNDTEYVCRYYNKFGPMIKQETYQDDSLRIPHGFFCWYNNKGKIDSCGWVLNFKKDSQWEYFLGDSTNATYIQKYDNGTFLYQKSYVELLNDTASKERDATQKEAVFKNGTNDWMAYVSRNLKVPERFASNSKRGLYTATVCFTINKQGKTDKVYLRKSLEWSADAVIFNLIERSPVWHPAIQKGEPVNYRQLQNLTMRLE